jgi:aspartate--ammonia ligase
MEYTIIPKGYKSSLDLRETEKAIKYIKDNFEKNLALALNLERVSAPLFLKKGSGINDDLNGVESKATFMIKDIGCLAEGLFSLAKWKRMKLAEYGFGIGQGLYTDMNAIRCDDSLDNLHSIYADQWDWEKAISRKQRTSAFLEDTVKKIYAVIKTTGEKVHKEFGLRDGLPDDITFIHAEDLCKEYPDLTPRQREDKVAERYGAIFIRGIGANLSDGKPHDGRAPDYDDWITVAEDGRRGLNGDIILWYSLLGRAFELSSMGIRVDKKSMLEQLRLQGKEERLQQQWHRDLIDGKYPLSIGGGIGQSRLCMFYLQKAHIGEVQSSIWPNDVIEICKKRNVSLL